jgi:hypothetical protein
MGGSPERARRQFVTISPDTGGTDSFGLAGVWLGTSVSDCYGMAPCRGLRHITITILPATAGGPNGFYRCEQITSACDLNDDRGMITETSIDRRLFSVNVQLPDDQNCTFRSLAAPFEMQGRFLCKQRAIVVDRGVWRAERLF